MHVLQITPRYFPNIGGVEVVVQKISERLVSRGFDVTVYSVDYNQTLPKKQKINGVIVKRFTPLFSDPLYLPTPDFVWSLRREEANIIHAHNVHTLPPSLGAVCKRKRQRFVLQPHYHRFGQSSLRHSLLSLYRRVINSFVFSNADAIIVNSLYEKQIFFEDFPKCRNVILIPEGIDVEEVKRVKHESVEPSRILYVGALRGYKNVDKILEGFATLVKRGGVDFRLVIVGSGPEYGFLVRRANELDIAAFVEWKHGLSREQLLCEYAWASVLVLLSPLESFSRVVYEALSIGVPTVVLNYGATAHLVKKGFAEGVNSLNPEEIADAMLRAMSKKYPKIAEDPLTFLSWKTYVNRIFDLYHRLSETAGS